MADHVPHLAHLNARDTTFVYVSRATQSDLARMKAKMNWRHPWFTILPTEGAAFDKDFGVANWHGTNAFIRDDDGRVYRTYFINGRGDEMFVGTWHLLDMTALGRQEDWEDSPEGYPQSPRTNGGAGTTPTRLTLRDGGSATRTPTIPTTSGRRLRKAGWPTPPTMSAHRRASTISNPE